MGGRFVAYKGREAATEVEEAEVALEELGGQLGKIEWDVEALASADRRALIFIEKVRGTPDRYPRRPGIPRKRPL